MITLYRNPSRLSCLHLAAQMRDDANMAENA